MADDLHVPTPEEERAERKPGFLERLRARRAARKQQALLLKQRRSEERAKREAERIAARHDKPDSDEPRERFHPLQKVLGFLHNPTGRHSELKAIADEEDVEKEMIEKDRGAASEKHQEEIERRQRKILKTGAKRTAKRKRDALYRRRKLSELLLKAGYEQKPERLQRIVFYISFILIAVTTLAVLVLGAVAGKRILDLVIFFTGLWTAVFALVYLVVWMVIYLFLDVMIYQRTRQLEDVLPDFLQLASANISAGMPIDRALWFSIRPNFGVLAKEIEEVAKSTLAGEELSDSLLKFTERYDSLILKRSISILLEGLDAGGEIAELLDKIALNIQETKILRKEMSANVATYAIFITFASIVMAPFLFALATQLLTIIVAITSTLDTGGMSSSFITINIQTDPKMIADFKWFSIMMLSVSALMSASIVSVIRRGRVKEGLRNLPIFLATSLFLYWLGSLALGGLFSGLIVG